MKKNRTTFVLLLFLFSICSAFYIGKQVNTQQRQETQRKALIHQVYSELSNCLAELSTLKNWDNIPRTNKLTHPYYRTLLFMDKLGSTFSDAHYFISSEIFHDNYEGLYGMSSVIDDGIALNDTGIIEGFWKDGKLSKTEIKFFQGLYNDLKLVKNKLYSEKAKEENIALSFDEVNHIFAPIFYKYSSTNVESTELAKYK